MPLDGISAKCLALELDKSLADARVDRIYQPDRFDIIMQLRSGRENVRLILSANPASPRLHLTTESRDNPSDPPMFCMLLRKHLLGARLMSVETPGYERIFIFRFQTMNELGDNLEKKLIVEIMGRHSNIILLNQDNRIHDAILHVDQSISRLREIMPARVYTEPHNQSKLTPEEALAQLKQGLPLLIPDDKMTLEKALLNHLQGFSPQLCREVIDRAGLDPRFCFNQLSKSEQDQFNLSLRQILDSIINAKFQPSTFYLAEHDNIPYDFHALPLQSLAFPRIEINLSAAMDRYYLERNRQNKIAQQRQLLGKKIDQEIEHTTKRLQLHLIELKEGEKREFYRQCGELLVSQQDKIVEGQNQVEVNNYFDPEMKSIRINLLPQLNPNQNAQRYFKLYQKARGKFETNSRLILEDQMDLDWLQSLSSATNRAQNEQDIQAIHEEIATVGLSSNDRRRIDNQSALSNASEQENRFSNKTQPADMAPGKPGSRVKRLSRLNQQKGNRKGHSKVKSKNKSNPPPLPPRSYVSSDGMIIQVGRNNIQNDRLTLRTAQKNDLWLHAQKVPGAHVVIRCGNLEVPSQTLEEAAQIAAWFSQATPDSTIHTYSAKSGQEVNLKVMVDYCPVSHVRKISGGRPGIVQYDVYKTILVQPRNPDSFLNSLDMKPLAD
jgi:predicted ribosome quality control (RQC) complex YloA/Tae2 family protein